jgi:NADPH:quinone reductase-like Zn-dependent oxidoreductase
VPRPKGSLDCLVPEPLPQPPLVAGIVRAGVDPSSSSSSSSGSLVVPEGMVLVAVRAVGINFRDVLNVSRSGCGITRVKERKLTQLVGRITVKWCSVLQMTE